MVSPAKLFIVTTEGTLRASFDVPVVTGMAWHPSREELWYSISEGRGAGSIVAVTPDGHKRQVWRGRAMALQDIASDDAEFCDPVVTMGVCGVEWFVHPFELGPRKAKELLFTADRVGRTDIALTHAFLGQMLGAGRTAVTATIARLEAMKLIERTRGHVTIGDVRGKGLMQALELVKDETAKDRTPDAATIMKIASTK